MTTHADLAVVGFPFDAEAVEIVRTIPGRRWHPDGRYWTIPPDAVRLAAARFYAAGFDVTIDGRYFEPNPSRAESDDPFVALLRVLPARLRVPVYRALALVLHPDVGGDVQLMRQLNAARRVEPWTARSTPTR